MSQKSPTKNIPANYRLMGQGVLENLAGCVQIMFYFHTVEMTYNRVIFWVETCVIFRFKLALRGELLRKNQRECHMECVCASVCVRVVCENTVYLLYKQLPSDLDTELYLHHFRHLFSAWKAWQNPCTHVKIYIFITMAIKPVFFFFFF